MLVSLDLKTLIHCQTNLACLLQAMVMTCDSKINFIHSEDDLAHAVDHANNIAEICGHVSMQVPAKAARELAIRLALPSSRENGDALYAIPQQQSIIAQGGYLTRSLKDALEGELFLAMDAQSSRLYASDDPLFGFAVLEAFPSASFDIGEAGKCRALGRWTASVMHLMRVLEVGLCSLAIFAGVNPHANWNVILDQIEASLKKIGKKSHSPEDEQFAAEAATHFRSIKNAWRNHAMHARATYDEERTIEIYDSVRSFMRHLASRLNEAQV